MDKLQLVTFFEDIADDDLMKLHHLGQLKAVCEYLNIESMCPAHTADSIFEEASLV
mgnify:CR=1 FL=1